MGRIEIPNNLGEVTKRENIERITIEYPLDKRNKIYDYLNSLNLICKIVRSGPKITDFPKVSETTGLIIVEIIK